jgi:hypothetical protein
LETPISKIIRAVTNRHLWSTPVILATRETEIRRLKVQGQPGQIVLETQSQKYPLQKAGGAAQVREHLPSKREALVETPVLPKIANNNNSNDNQSKMDWRCGSSCRESALQA